MNFNTGFSSALNLVSALQQQLPEDFNIVNHWKNLDFTSPETIQKLASNENCTTIISLLKTAGYLSEKQVKLIYTSIDMYKNEGWKNWDLNDPKAIENLAKNPNYDLMIDAMKDTGYLNDDQIKSLRSKVKFFLKAPELISAFKKDLNDLQNVSKLQIFALGERKINSLDSNSRWKMAFAVGGAALSVISFIGAAPFISQGETTGQEVGKVLILGGAGLLYVATKKLYSQVENCMIEGYYLRTKEIVEKHFQKTLGKEGVEFILANLNDKGQLDQATNKVFRQAVDRYLKG